MNQILTADGWTKGSYFLQELNTPSMIIGVRILICLVVLFLVGAYIYAIKKNKEDKKDK